MIARRATYRLQLSPAFTFADAIAAIPYLRDLGISHLYLSPILQAARGSTHGYDVVDPTRVSEELGGEEGFRALAGAVRAAGMGILLDIVPNHMSIAGPENRWWWDVLENGPASVFAHVFDIEWGREVDERIVLPILGERYGRALTSRSIRLVATGSRVEVVVGDLRLPVSARSLGPIIKNCGGPDDLELAFLGDALVDLPTSRDADPEHRARRDRDRRAILDRLAAFAEPIAAAVAAVDADASALDALLERQNYRLVHWSVASDKLAHRRFFDIASLIGVRVEDPEVFELSHARILRWLADGSIDGVRIDHVDGLRDPAGYLARLRARAPGAWIVVEKIVTEGEVLPAWPIDGTTGYELAETTGRMWTTPRPHTTAFTSRDARRTILDHALHGELERVTSLAVRVCGASPMCRDFTRTEIREALAELLYGWPVYRTYGPGDPARAIVDRAVAGVPASIDRDLLAHLATALAFESSSPDAHELAHVMQQISGAIVAKGDEDTLAYRDVERAHRCEVGAALDRRGATTAELHARLAAGPPHALLASSTHDTKRSEDVRARIAALHLDPVPSPLPPFADATIASLAWQTLVGAWPIEHARMRAYLEKASREAALHTSWRSPNADYDRARDAWIDAIYADRAVLDSIAQHAARVAPIGQLMSLAATLVKLTAPGVPDFYQGSEYWTDSLVDPDNRRPVTFEPRDHPKRDLIASVLALRARRPALFEAPYRALPSDDDTLSFARGDSMIVSVPRFGMPKRGIAPISVGDGWTNHLAPPLVLLTR